MAKRSLLQRLAVLATLCLTLFAPFRARAAVFDVDTTADVLTTSGLSLRRALALASANGEDDIINLQPNASYTLSLCSQGALQHTDAHLLTIEGNAATIVQTCAGVGAFDNTNYQGGTTLNDLTLDGGGTATVGVHAIGTLELDDCTVTGFKFQGIYGGFPLVVRNSNVFGNRGDGIDGGGSMTIEGSAVSGNGKEGVIGVDADLSIIDSDIIGNGSIGVRGTGQGDRKVSVVNSNVSSNGAAGVCCTFCAEIRVTASVIKWNGYSPSNDYRRGFNPCENGGGIVFLTQLIRPYLSHGLSVLDSLVSGNSAQHEGGGILADADGAPGSTTTVFSTIFNSTVSDNTAWGDGGGAAVLTGTLDVWGSSFSGNAANYGSSSIGSGGGLAFVPNSGRSLDYLWMYGSSFASNTAIGVGGGLYANLASSGTVSLDRLGLWGNLAFFAGGGAALFTQVGALSDSYATSNHSMIGGGLFLGGVAQSALRVRRSTFADNVATLHGGGIATNDIDVSLINSTVTNNIADAGGGVSVGVGGQSAPEQLWLDSSTVVDNAWNLLANEGSVTSYASVITRPSIGSNCAGGSSHYTSLGRNFLPDFSCGSAPSDRFSTADPMLAALANNGGLTLTRLPSPLSPIRNLIPVWACSQAEDQRGTSRPQGTACEPGAVEIVGATKRFDGGL